LDDANVMIIPFLFRLCFISTQDGSRGAIDRE